MHASDVMTTQVVTVDPETDVESVARLLLDKGFSAVPVVTAAGKVVGIVSEGDLMRQLEDRSSARSWWLDLVASPREDLADYVKTRGQHAGDVMSREVVSVTEDTPIADIARLLETRRIKRVPVLRGDRLVGIVSRANLLQGLSASRSSIGSPSSDDRTLRQRVTDAVSSVPGITRGWTLNATVTDGVAEIWGIAEDEEEARAVRVAAESVEGVRGVNVHLGRIPAWGWGI